MWVLTTSGFFSAVASADNTTDVVVRARHRDDLAHLNRALVELGFKASKVLAYKHSDYPWRVVITKEAWGAYLEDEAQRIDYRNFKNEVTRKQGQKRHDIYSKVWSALLGLEHLPGALREHAKVVKKTPARPSLYAGFRPSAETEAWWAEQDARDKAFDADPDAPLDLLDDPNSPFYIGRSM